MKKLIGIILTSASLAGCASPSTYTQPSRTYTPPPGDTVSSSVGNETTRTAHECNEAYGVGSPQGLGVDKVDDYLECIDRAKNISENQGESLEPIEPGSSIEVDTNYAYHPGEMKLNNGNIMREENWDSLQKVLPSNQSHRDAIIDAFSRYWFEYDKFDNTLKVEPLRYIDGPYSQTSYVSLRGEVSDGASPQFRIEFKFYGSDWLFANRVRVNVDGTNWDSGPLDFSRDHTDKIWETVSLPLSGRGLEVANLIASGNDVTIRFSGPDYYHDFVVPDVMKKDLAAMLKAIEYL